MKANQKGAMAQSTAVLIVIVIILAAVAGYGWLRPAPAAETATATVTTGAGVVTQTVTVTAGATTTPVKQLKIFAIFATPIDEPWDNVIHQALKKAQTEFNFVYEWSDKNGYGPDFERELRRVAAKGYDIIFGDAFGNEEAVRRVAKEYPKTYFVFGSGLGPMDPNVAVFDDWIHESAYLAGMAAGKLTKTNTIGIVGGMPVEEVNRIINGFKLGAKAVNPDVKFKVTFINSWYDPPRAKEAALAFVDVGADVLYAERAGVIEAAKDRGVYAVGNMLDQHDIAPGTVITSAMWDMYPLVKYVITSVQGGTFVSIDLREWTMLAKGGAYIAPYREFDNKIPQDVKDKIDTTVEQIKEGLFRVPIDETTPVSD